MSIGKKIAAGYGIALGCLLAVGGVGHRGTNELVGTARWVAHTHIVLENLEVVRSRLTDAETGQRGYLLLGKESYLRPYREAVATVDGAIDTLAALTADNPNQRRRVESLRVAVAAKLAELAETIELRSSNGPEAALAVAATDRGSRLMDEIRDVVAGMKAEEHELLKARDRQAAATVRVTSLAITWGTIAASVLMTVCAIVTARGLVIPIRTLVAGTSEVGRGNFGHQIEVRSGDEIGALAESFNRMTRELRQTTVSAETERAARRQTEQLLVSIREASSQLSAAASEILASTTEQATGAREQAAAVGQTVTTVDEVAQTADQSARRARDVGETARSSFEVGQTGRKAVEDSLQALGLLRDRIETTTASIVELAGQAQAIGEIIVTVTDIAEQTNLLSLNAAIEASRAGEHGRGFAVVAAEVKLLAAQSKQATARVREILGEIQGATRTAVLSTGEVTRGVAEAIRVGDQAGRTINALADTLSDVSLAAAQISASAGQQASGMAQINQAMKSLDQASRQNLAATRQVEQAARDLHTLGGRLAGLTTA